ncbi:hypothetical protein JHN45_48525, partial [Streptomyces sp. MBT53]|nr:hypothetical protein [Streptomyces sp. MBT53]
ADHAAVRAALARDRATLQDTEAGLRRDQEALSEARAQLPGVGSTADTLRANADTARGHAQDAARVHADTRETHEQAEQVLREIDDRIGNALGRRDDAAARRVSAETMLPRATGPVLAAGPSTLPTSHSTLASAAPRWPGSGRPRAAGPSTGNTPPADDTAPAGDTRPAGDGDGDIGGTGNENLGGDALSAETTTDPITAPITAPIITAPIIATTSEQDSAFDALVGGNSGEGSGSTSADLHTAPGDDADHASHRRIASQPPAFQRRQARGNAVDTRGDGRCMLYTFIGTDPQRVRDALPGLRNEAPETYAWLGRPSQVRAGLHEFTHWDAQTSPMPLAGRHLMVAADRLRNLADQRLLDAHVTRPLPPEVVGQVRQALVSWFSKRTAAMSRPELLNTLGEYGIEGVTEPEQLDDLDARYVQALTADNGTGPATPGAPAMFDYLRDTGRLPTLDDLSDEQLRTLLGQGYTVSEAQFTDAELAHAVDAVDNWAERYENDEAEVFLPLLADTLDLAVEVLRPGPTATTSTVTLMGPATATRVIEVHYTNLNHYSATDADILIVDPTTITPSSAPRGPEDANSLQPGGRYRPAPTRDAADDLPASQVADPAPKNSWFGLRAYAPPAVHSTERFDPHADQSNAPRPGVLSGATTLVRTSIRRIQAPNGQWVRDYTLNLPVTTTDPSHTAQLQERITRLLDAHLNSGLELPSSGDQLHVTLNLIDDPSHPEAITLTDTENPVRADQLHLDLGHSDADLLHEVLHYLGLPDEQRDNDFLLRNHPNSTTVRTTGLMADTQNPVDIPRRYLRTIENVTSAGPQLHDHAGQLVGGPVQDPDTTPIPADSSLTWPTSSAPAVPPSPRGQLPSTYVTSYGSLPDGTVGLVYAEPFSDEVIEGLHGQVYEALGYPDDVPESVREQVRDVLSRESLALQLPYLRSNGGYRVTVRVDGRDRTVDVQLTLSDARESLRQGRFDTRDPDKHVERRGFGTRENFSTQPSGTYRTVQVPWTGSRPITAPLAVRAVDGSVTFSLTHNQASDATTVTQAVQTTSAQRSNEPSDPVEFTTNWRVRVDAPAVTATPATTATAPAPDGWSAPVSHGPTTIWFPRHLTTADPAPGSLPAAADPAGLPLYGVDSVIDPRALYEHAHQTFHAHLDATAAGQVADFLSEQVLRGTLPMQIHGGLYSPVITDADGNAVGMLRLITRPGTSTPLRESTAGQINLESHLVNTAKMDLSSKYTSGIGFTASVAGALTGDHSEGHPDASSVVGGSLGLRAQAQATVTNTYSASSSAGTMHAIRTNQSHLLAQTAVTYEVTLIRPDGREIDAPDLDLTHGMDLRLLSRTTAAGRTPTPAETRELPHSLERLDGIGLSAAPLDVTGTDELFDRAEAWLRDRGFLPSAPTGIGLVRNYEPEHQIRLHAQLNNLRRLREARSRTGLRAATDAMVDGGHALHFEVPTGTDTGVRRVRLLLTAERDTTQASRHDLVLPGVQVMGLAQMAGSDAEQRGESYSGALGLLASISGPVGPWGTLGGGLDYQRGPQVTHGDTVGGATGHDQFFIATNQNSHAFDVPVRLALDLYANDADEPSVRFGQDINRAAQAAAPAVAAAPTAPGVPPVAPAPPSPTVTGTLRLAVPEGRTRTPSATPAPPPARVDEAPRPVDDEDRERLEGTDAHGVPHPDLVRIPDDALIDTVRGSAAIESVFRRAAAVIRRQAQQAQPTTPAVPATGPILPVAAAAIPPAPAAPGTAAGPQRTGLPPLAGQGLTDSTTRAAETRHAAITPGSLVAHGHELFKNSYVVEGLSLPGTLADGQYTLEIQAVAHRPRLLDTTRQYLETGVSATDSAQQLKSLGKARQWGTTGVATQNPSTPAEKGSGGPESDGSVSTSQTSGKPNKLQLNPSIRLNQVSRADTSDTLSASTGVNRTPTESGNLHRVVADVTYVVTVRAGSRTLLNGVRDLGTIEPVSFAVNVPDGLQFLMTQGQLDRDARWMGSVQGLTPTPVQGQAPLPTAFVQNWQLGLGGVLSVTEYETAPAPAAVAGQIPLVPVNGRERRGEVGRALLDLVETEAPGVITPGHAGYQQGVHSRVAQLTSTAGLRSLPGRGPDGTQDPATTRFHFRHHAYGGERLVEVMLTAVPRRAQNLAGIRGTTTPGSGLEQWQSHTAAGRSLARAAVGQVQLPITITNRYLRPFRDPEDSRTDRAAPVLTPQSAGSVSVRRATTADNRFWLRTDHGADFDGLRYDYELSVRSALVADWPPNVIGGLIQNGVIAWADADGDVRRWIDAMLAGGNSRTSTVPVRLALRFTGTEATALAGQARVNAPSVVSDVDPRNTVRPAGPAAGPYLTDAQMFHPVGPTPAFHFDGWAHLETALNQVAPRLGRSWHAQITSVSVEGQAVRLGQLIQAGRAALDRPRRVADLTAEMPGTAPFEGAPSHPPTIAVTLYNPRRSTHADDVTLDQLHNTTDTVSTAAGADHSFATSFTELLSGDEDNHEIGGLSVPLAQRQTQPSAFGGTTTGSRRDWLKSGSTSAPANGARGTRSYVVDADAHLLVEGPRGTRHVTGTVTLRIEERDLLGHGLLTPAEFPPDVHDLPALVPDWADAEPHTLPERLHNAIPVGRDGVQFWVALGDDPQGARLGQALYMASRTAVLGHRPVELMTRDQQGVRRWEFTAEGALVTADPDLTTAWNAFDAQAEILQNATDTLADTPRLLNLRVAARRQANGVYTAARTVHQEAQAAVTDATSDHTRARTAVADSAEAVHRAEALVTRLKRELTEAQRAVATLPSVIQQHARDEIRGRHDLRTALAALTQAENAVRAERIAAAEQAA